MGITNFVPHYSDYTEIELGDPTPFGEIEEIICHITPERSWFQIKTPNDFFVVDDYELKRYTPDTWLDILQDAEYLSTLLQDSDVSKKPSYQYVDPVELIKRASALSMNETDSYERENELLKRDVADRAALIDTLKETIGNLREEITSLKEEINNLPTLQESNRVVCDQEQEEKTPINILIDNPENIEVSVEEKNNVTPEEVIDIDKNQEYQDYMNYLRDIFNSWYK